MKEDNPERQTTNIKRHQHWLKVFLIFAVVSIVLGEIALRSIGFLSAPLYRDSDSSKYVQVENQDLTRFGNHFVTNEYSMRSLPLKEDEYRVLVAGDSVLNGGTQTDHDMLATSMLEKDLNNDALDKNIRVLNASSGGWGIDNVAGFVRENGDFDAKLIVLVLNSHDAIGDMGESDVAGTNLNFPDEQYPLAWFELLDRYLIPRVKAALNIGQVDEATNNSDGQEHSEGWNFFVDYCQKNNIPLVIYLHVTQHELAQGEYDENGKWIMDFAKTNGIPLVSDIKEISAEDYRDDIHLSGEGQKVIYDILYPILEEQVER